MGGRPTQSERLIALETRVMHLERERDRLEQEHDEHTRNMEGRLEGFVQKARYELVERLVFWLSAISFSSIFGSLVYLVKRAVEKWAP